ncbi:MAG: chromosomal replication initiator protein DnaA [Candidatus Margulisbacteria bacterium]|jgi:chromosomal replication initiator protein|nr:chromosomal replication initiator protein DnaA [Candidatus Margulisiibacteriota bacterium]
MDSFWPVLLEKLKTALTGPGFQMFKTSIAPLSLADGVLAVSVPSDVMALWLKEREPLLQEIFTRDFRQNIALDVRVVPAAPELSPAPVVRQLPSAAEEVPAEALVKFNPKYTFETFVVGNNTRFAHAAALAVAEKPFIAYNPLFTYGGPGLGKTHLMHAIAQRALSLNPKLKIVLVTAETFVNEVVSIIRDGSDVARWKNFYARFRMADILLVDDIQFLMGKDRSQEEFFNTFNALYETKKQIILNSDRPPKDLRDIDERLKSRMAWGLITDIQSPDFETRLAVLRKKVESDSTIENANIPEDVIQYIAKAPFSNVRDLESVLHRLVAHTAFFQTPITVDFAAKLLKDLIQTQDKHVTISTIKQIVAEQMKIDIEELSAKIRKKEIATARQIAMYLSRELTSATNEKIGDTFGGRDHSTVIHACDKIRETIKTDHALLDLVNNLKKEILAR